MHGHKERSKMHLVYLKMASEDPTPRGHERDEARAPSLLLAFADEK